MVASLCATSRYFATILGLSHAQQIASPLGGIQWRSWGVRPQDQCPCQCYRVRQWQMYVRLAHTGGPCYLTELRRRHSAPYHKHDKCHESFKFDLQVSRSFSLSIRTSSGTLLSYAVVEVDRSILLPCDKTASGH